MKTTSLRKGSRYHGCVIVERLDSRQKNHRQIYRCISDDRDCVLVRFILKDVPSSLVQLDDLHLPTEYVFVDCYNSMYPVEVLPNIISCDFDSDEAWYVRDYINGTSLREEVEYCHRMNETENENKLLDAFISWLIMSGHMFNMFLPTNMKYNLTPDNLFISRESDGSPKLVILDLESALSVEADITNDDMINADTSNCLIDILLRSNIMYICTYTVPDQHINVISHQFVDTRNRQSYCSYFPSNCCTYILG